MFSKLELRRSIVFAVAAFAAPQMASLNVQAADQTQSARSTPESQLGLGGADRDTPTAIVNLGDLNLKNAEGVKQANARIAKAVDSVCPKADMRDLSRVALEQECKAKAHELAIAQLERLTVQQRLASTNGKCEAETHDNAVAQVR